MLDDLVEEVGVRNAAGRHHLCARRASERGVEQRLGIREEAADLAERQVDRETRDTEPGLVSVAFLDGVGRVPVAEGCALGARPQAAPNDSPQGAQEPGELLVNGQRLGRWTADPVERASHEPERPSQLEQLREPGPEEARQTVERIVPPWLAGLHLDAGAGRIERAEPVRDEAQQLDEQRRPVDRPAAVPRPNCVGIVVPGPDIALLFTVSDHGAVATNLRPDRHRLLRPRQNDIRIVEERVEAAPDQQVLEAIGKDH